MTSHALALVDTAWGQTTTNRTTVAEELVATVAGNRSGHVVPLDYALEALAFALANNVDEGKRLEDGGRSHRLADFERIDLLRIESELTHDAGWLDVELRVQTKLWLGAQTERLLAVADLHGRVTILFDGALAEDDTVSDVNHRDANSVALRGEHLGHTDLFAEEANAIRGHLTCLSCV